MVGITFPLLETTSSEEQTCELAAKFAKLLHTGVVVAFNGQLGAGKTTFIRALVSHLQGSAQSVNSPTFTYLNIYDSKWPIYHFDVYRIKDANDFILMGFESYFSKDGICFIEWASKIESVLPNSHYLVEMKFINLNQREIQISHVNL